MNGVDGPRALQAGRGSGLSGPVKVQHYKTGP